MRKILKSYLFWTYPRGSFHYDVMVTLILVFIFGSPWIVNYRDRPKPEALRGGGILVKASDDNSFTYDFPAAQLEDADLSHPADLKEQIQERIEEISGPVRVDSLVAHKDASGKVTGYEVRAHRLMGGDE